MSEVRTPPSLDTLTMTRCRELLAAGELTSVGLVETVFARLEATEPFVHAYVWTDRDAAVAAARRLDEERAAGRLRGPLHGLPLSVKDIFRVPGMPTAAGSRAYTDPTPDRAAPAVQLCQDAGAVVLGKLVTHEFALGQDVPDTRSAWNLEHYPGGSSAGAGVAVAVGSALAALGTDSAGSVRKPAALTGVVGFKPTYGVVDTGGVVPLSPSLDHVGTLTRSVADCRLLFDVLASGSPALDASSEPEPVDLRGVRLGICDYFVDSAHAWPEVRSSFELAVQRLRERGATIVDVPIPALASAVAAGFVIMAAEAAAVHATRLRARGPLYSTPTRVLLQAASLLPASLAERAQQVRELIRGEVRDTFEGHRIEALLAPTVARTSMRLSDMVPEQDLAEYIRNTVVANLTGQPAVTIPAGLTGHGLPVGLQLTGRPYGDHALLRLAASAEETVQEGFRVPPMEWLTAAGAGRAEA